MAKNPKGLYIDIPSMLSINNANVKDKLSPIDSPLYLDQRVSGANSYFSPSIVKNKQIDIDGSEVKYTPRNRNPSQSNYENFINEEPKSPKRTFYCFSGSLCKQDKTVIHALSLLVIIIFASALGYLVYSSTENNMADLVTTTPGFRKSKVIEMTAMPKMTTAVNVPLKAIQISSLEDFLRLKRRNEVLVDTIIIQKLVDSGEGNNLGHENPLDKLNIKNPDAIRNLKIVGPITEHWLKNLLEKFIMVEHLTIDIDELCIGGVIPDRTLLKSITLHNLVDLHLKNSHYCTIISWIFRWELPKLENLIISNSDLTRRTFSPIHDFLARHETSLKIIIEKSFMCSECNFTDAEHKKARIIVVDNLDDSYMNK